jgi:hypothetical protein
MSRRCLVGLFTFVLLASAASTANAQWGYGYPGHYGPYWGSFWGPYYYYEDWRPQLRVKVRPEKPGDTAAIYIDGARAGVGDDFDGIDQGMGFSAGAHTVVVFLEGYRTQKFDVYLREGETTKLRVALQPLGPGERSERPEMMSDTRRSSQSGRRYR